MFQTYTSIAKTRLTDNLKLYDFRDVNNLINTFDQNIILSSTYILL